MSVKSKTKDLLTEFGKELSVDLEESLLKALKDGGRKNPQTTKLNFKEKAYIDGEGVSMDIIASGEYWKFIESGRKKGARRIPADVVGKKWQGANGIDPRKVLIQLRLKRNSKLKISKRSLNYDKAARSLSFIIQRSIFNKGIRPKPFVDRVVKDGRIDVLKERLREVLGPAYKLEITLDGSNL